MVTVFGEKDGVKSGNPSADLSKPSGTAAAGGGCSGQSERCWNGCGYQLHRKSPGISGGYVQILIFMRRLW